MAYSLLRSGFYNYNNRSKSLGRHRRWWILNSQSSRSWSPRTRT
jgi:ribosomal protein L28